jgi:GntR family transcriptional repressor for pyruvate dehydrogenase complex
MREAISNAAGQGSRADASAADGDADGRSRTMVRQSTTSPVVPIERVNRFKVSGVVAAQIERMIVSGELGAGDRLPSERELSERFGVSRNSTREALRLLEANGLVTILHGIGSFVNDRDSTAQADQAASLLVVDELTVPELFEVRVALEGEMAALAAQRATPADIERMWELVERMDNEAVTDGEYVDIDVALHGAIAEATKNVLFKRLWLSLEEAMRRYSHRVIGFPGRRAQASSDHRKIVELIERRRPSGARRAVVMHLRAVEEEIVRQLDVPVGASDDDESS